MTDEELKAIRERNEDRKRRPDTHHGECSAVYTSEVREQLAPFLTPEPEAEPEDGHPEPYKSALYVIAYRLRHAKAAWNVGDEDDALAELNRALARCDIALYPPDGKNAEDQPTLAERAWALAQQGWVIVRIGSSPEWSAPGWFAIDVPHGERDSGPLESPEEAIEYAEDRLREEKS